MGDNLAVIVIAVGRPAADRLLADRRRRARVRGAPPLPHRREPGVGGAGDGERRRRRLPGHARLDQPVGELPQRVLRAPAPRSPPSSPAALVLATLVVLAPLFSDLPKAVLAAIIIDAVVFGMIDVARDAPAPPRHPVRLLDRDGGDRRRAVGRRPRRRRRRRRPVAGVAGLRGDAPADAAPRPGGGDQVFRELDEHPGDEPLPGVAVLRFDGGLFFATAESLENRVRAVADGDGPLHALVLDLEGVNFIDSQGASTLAEVHARDGRRRRRAAPGEGQAAGAARAGGGRRRRAASARTTSTRTIHQAVEAHGRDVRRRRNHGPTQAAPASSRAGSGARSTTRSPPPPRAWPARRPMR